MRARVVSSKDLALNFCAVPCRKSDSVQEKNSEIIAFEITSPQMQRHLLYCCIALECDAPILEALWLTTPSLPSTSVWKGMEYSENLLPLLVEKLVQCHWLIRYKDDKELLATTRDDRETIGLLSQPYGAPHFPWRLLQANVVQGSLFCFKMLARGRAIEAWQLRGKTSFSKSLYLEDGFAENWRILDAPFGNADFCNKAIELAHQLQ
jgi:hypothetical protein